MELRQLEHFVTVAEERNFTRAAKHLTISQSGLSASIRALERELRATLFVRTTRRVELTEAGRALLNESQRTLLSAAAAKEAVAAAKGLMRGTLRVGAEQFIAGVDVPALLAAFRTAHPGVEIVLSQAGTASLLDDVSQGRLDLAFVATSPQDIEGVFLRPLATEPMVVVCHPGHPLAAASEVGLEDLAEETFVDFEKGWGARNITEQAFAAAGIRRNVALEVNDIDTLVALVSHGLGIAFVPQPIACRLPTAALHAGRIAEWQVSLATPDGDRSSLAARAMLRLLPDGASVENPASHHVNHL
jgi:DNA-binding transcriptional LysR family regulator